MNRHDRKIAKLSRKSDVHVFAEVVAEDIFRRVTTEFDRRIHNGNDRTVLSVDLQRRAAEMCAPKQIIADVARSAHRHFEQLMEGYIPPKLPSGHAVRVRVAQLRAGNVGMVTVSYTI